MPRWNAISVVTPVFNGEKYIGETVESVLRQIGPNDQYIVIDDGSIDGTLAELAKYGSQIRVVTQSNGGEASAVNLGVSLADSEVVGIVNADDPIRSGLLDAVRRAFTEHHGIAAVYPDWELIDDCGRVLHQVRTRPFSLEVLLAEHLCVPGPGAFFLRDAVIGEPVRDDRAWGNTDFDFWLRFALRGHRAERIPHVLATWRSHSQGSTSTMDGGRLARSKIETIMRLFERPDVTPAMRRLRARAISAAYYHAALIGLRQSNVPALWYGFQSYAYCPLWRSSEVGRRSPAALLYAACQPLSGAVHRRLDPLLRPSRRQSALMAGTFGIEMPK